MSNFYNVLEKLFEEAEDDDNKMDILTVFINKKARTVAYNTRDGTESGPIIFTDRGVANEYYSFIVDECHYLDYAFEKDSLISKHIRSNPLIPDDLVCTESLKRYKGDLHVMQAFYYILVVNNLLCEDATIQIS
jgi:hypothetical protein